MLRHTFVHLPGVGLHREKKLWNEGILDWPQFLAASRQASNHVWCQEAAVSLIHRSLDALSRGDPGFFRSVLPSREAWRLFSEFADQAVFLDIETTGLSAATDDLTLIGAYAAGELSLFVNGHNLDEFPAYIERFPLIVSFNGSQFDVPFLRTHFPHARLDQPHVDLRFVLASLGFKGGLKAVETRLGLDRAPSLQGVDGFEAVRLWRCYQKGDRSALEKLAFYNLTDVANLLPLAEFAVESKWRSLSFPGQPASPLAQTGRRLAQAEIAEWAARRVREM